MSDEKLAPGWAEKPAAPAPKPASEEPKSPKRSDSAELMQKSRAKGGARGARSQHLANYFRKLDEEGDQ